MCTFISLTYRLLAQLLLCPHRLNKVFWGDYYELVEARSDVKWSGMGGYTVAEMCYKSKQDGRKEVSPDINDCK